MRSRFLRSLTVGSFRSRDMMSIVMTAGWRLTGKPVRSLRDVVVSVGGPNRSQRLGGTRRPVMDIIRSVWSARRRICIGGGSGLPRVGVGRWGRVHIVGCSSHRMSWRMVGFIRRGGRHGIAGLVFL
jgi:hypothetical protein